MKLRSALLLTGIMNLLVPMAFAENAAQPATAQPAAKPDAKSAFCEAFDQTELGKLLGGTPTLKFRGPICQWTVDGGKYKLVATKFGNTGMAAEMAFDDTQRKLGTTIKETGIGDRSFAHMEQYGVSMLIIKDGKLMQLQYGAGNPGTDKDLNALLPLAKKVAGAF